jgi:hypothetical protein
VRESRADKRREHEQLRRHLVSDQHQARENNGCRPERRRAIAQQHGGQAQPGGIEE